MTPHDAKLIPFLEVHLHLVSTLGSPPHLLSHEVRPFGNIWKGKVAPNKGTKHHHGLLTPYLPPSFHPPKITWFLVGLVPSGPQLLQGIGQEFPKRKSPPSELRGFLMDFFLVPELSREDFSFFETIFLPETNFFRNSLKTSWNPTRGEWTSISQGCFFGSSKWRHFWGCFSEGSNFYFPPRKIQQCLQFTIIY